MKYLSLAFIAAARAEFVEDDEEAFALLRQLASHNVTTSNETATTTTTTTTTVVTQTSTNATSAPTSGNSTVAADDVKVQIASAVTLALGTVPTVAAEITTFKTAVNKEVGKEYCASLSCPATGTCPANTYMFQTVADCYSKESTETAATAAGMAQYWNAAVEWTGATGFAAPSAAQALNPSRRRLTTAAGAAYAMSATQMASAASATAAAAALTNLNAAFKASAESTGATGLGEKIKTGVNTAMTAAGYNYTMTAAPSVTATAPAATGAPAAAATSGATSLVASASALLAAVASVALF